MRQCAGTASVAATHAACSVTLRTGSPMFAGAIDAVSDGPTQSASVTVRLATGAGPAVWGAPRSTPGRTAATTHAHPSARFDDFLTVPMKGLLTATAPS
jgi:hypothetical protein